MEFIYAIIEIPITIDEQKAKIEGINFAIIIIINNIIENDRLITVTIKRIVSSESITLKFELKYLLIFQFFYPLLILDIIDNHYY